MSYSHPIYLQQVGLQKLGFDPGRIDGQDGPRTRAAFAKSLPVPAGGNHLPATLVRLALQEIGVRETPTNSNSGPRVRQYQAATWLDGSGWPWCAAFVCWLCREAGMPDSPRPQTAGAWDFETWARLRDDVAQLLKPGTDQILAGDILVLKISHIGLAADDEDGWSVRTIEGNTDASGSREGGGVYARTRRVAGIRSIIRLR